MKAVPKRIQKSELERFAGIFHQDFGVETTDIEEYAQDFFRTLSKRRRTTLRIKLIKLLEENPGKKQKGLINEWFRLGAQWWGRQYDLRDCIVKWIHILS